MGRQNVDRWPHQKADVYIPMKQKKGWSTDISSWTLPMLMILNLLMFFNGGSRATNLLIICQRPTWCGSLDFTTKGGGTSRFLIGNSQVHPGRGVFVDVQRVTGGPPILWRWLMSLQMSCALPSASVPGNGDCTAWYYHWYLRRWAFHSHGGVPPMDCL